ncbi:hypothetical protein [Streptomyces sp. TR06-5]|uniref:Rv1733c family protein n=1 Tax=unclassified Streptomyces TaxID=2593676 RepID=UPI0039A27FA6
MNGSRSPHASPGPSGPSASRPNPLQRPVDRLQARLERWLVVTVVIGALAAALAAGNAGYSSQDSALREERAARQQVSAVLVTDAWGTADAAPSGTTHQAQVRWTGPEGDRHRDVATVPATADKGDTVRVWTDRDGTITTPPRSTSARATGWAAALMAAAGVVTVGFAGRQVLRRLVDRRRLRAWEEEWAVVEARWTGRRPG